MPKRTEKNENWDKYGVEPIARDTKENFQDYGFKAEAFINAKINSPGAPLPPRKGQLEPPAPRFVRATKNANDVSKRK